MKANNVRVNPKVREILFKLTLSKFSLPSEHSYFTLRRCQIQVSIFYAYTGYNEVYFRRLIQSQYENIGTEYRNTMASFHVFSSSLLANHPIIRRCNIWDADSVIQMAK